MPRKTDRNLIADFATLGIEYLPNKGPEVSDDIQMVYIMGDVTGAGLAVSTFVPGFTEPNPINREYGIDIDISATVGENATVEILALATGGGIWVTPITSNSNNTGHVWTIAALSGLGTTLNPTAANSSAFGAGLAATAVVEFGTQVSADPVNAMLYNMGGGQFGWAPNLILRPFYLGPGRVMVYESNSANAALDMGFLWREVV